jgi:hypothetical protein
VRTFDSYRRTLASSAAGGLRMLITCDLPSSARSAAARVMNIQCHCAGPIIGRFIGMETSLHGGKLKRSTRSLKLCGCGSKPGSGTYTGDQSKPCVAWG